MNIEELKKEREERELWRKTTFLGMLDDLRWRIYRGYHKVIDFPRETKYNLQRLFRGYGDDDLWGLYGFIIRKTRPALKAFVKYQREHGHGCPMGYTVDEEGKDVRSAEEGEKLWLVDLEKMELAFDLEWEEEMGTDEYFKKTTEQHIGDNKKIQEGFELFGKYLRNLWD